VFTEQGEGWEETSLGDVVTLQGGSQPPKSTFTKEQHEGYIRLIQIRDYKSDKYIVFIPKEKAKRFCNEDDIMIGRYGPPLFQILRGIEGAYNVALMKAMPDEDRLTKNYLYYFLQNRNLFNYIDRSSGRTAGQTGFKKEVLEGYPIAFPSSFECQADIVDQLETLKSTSLRLEQLSEGKLTALDELKQSILQKAFTGQLTAKSPELELVP
jgi:type I restriction enzyme S subunit